MKTNRNHINGGLRLLGGIGLGAGLMYILDPYIGRRRRALARDKVTRFAHKTADAIEVTSRDLKNRARGFVAQTRSLIPKGEVPDEVLADRVRAKLGFLVSHPSAIEVEAKDGTVRLSGPILASEVNRLLRRVHLTRGVKGVEDRLEAHESADSVPGLQGEPVQGMGGLPDIMQSNWSPATRFLAGSGAAGLIWWGAKQRNNLGGLAAILGAGIAARALTNMEFKRLLGLGAGRRAVDIHKIINISAPVEQVFSFWADYQNFPRFMSNVRQVRQMDEQRSHWVVAGPAGAPVEWDAEVTNFVPNRSLGWKTAAGSPIQHAGIVKFQPNPDGTTRLDLRMSYNPVAGAVGHAVAALFGADPKSEIDADLMRMKSMIETGVPPQDAAR